MKAFNFYTLADLGKKTDKGYEILKVGTMYSKKYGKIEVTQGMIDTIVAHFNDNVLETAPYIDVEHKRTEGSCGPITKALSEDGKLYIDIDWNNRGKELVDDKQFMYLSAHIDEALDSKTGKTIPLVLLGAALTNYPVYKDQSPLYELTLSETPLPTGEKADGSGSDKNKNGGNPMEEFKKALEALTQAISALPDDAAKEQAKKDAAAAIGVSMEMACKPGEKKMSEIEIKLAEEAKLQLKEVSDKVKTLSEENAGLRKQIKASEFDAAYLGKKITADNKDRFFSLFLADEENTKAILESMPDLKLTDEIGKTGKGDTEFKLTEKQEGIAKETGYDVTKPEERKRFLESIKD